MRLVGLQFTVPFRIIRIFQYNVKMEISAKLKARHVQIHIFHTEKTESPGVTNIENDHHRYRQTGS